MISVYLLQFQKASIPCHPCDSCTPMMAVTQPGWKEKISPMETKDTPQEERPAEGPPPEEASAAVGERHPLETVEPEERVIVAGIGASAGGLQALQAFFEALPENLGVAFVVIVHLSPEHPSHLAEILATCTSMPVEQVQSEVLLEGDHVYVIPPGHRLEVTDTSAGVFPF